MKTAHQKNKILLVDDEPTNLKLLGGILREEYALVFARNGAEMLRFATEGPDLILLDIMMPDMDGYEGCSRLKANTATQNIPVIFVTAKIEVADEIRGFAVGAVDYLTKPVQAAIVRARVKTHLALQHSRKIIEQQNQEIKKQNAALLAAAQLRDDVEQIVRHDLKSPLNAVIGMSDLLVNHMQLDEDTRELIRSIEGSGYRMLDMINRSHDIYKMERGAYNINPKPVDIMVTLKRITSELKSRIKNKKLSINIFLDGKPALPKDAFFISGEELLCHSMLSNIIKNAIEASPRAESLTILLDTKEQMLIRVSNKGNVPVEIIDKFFEKNVTAGKPNGVGLGTYSAKLIATTMGGKIQLDTTQEGETSIMIKFPVSC